MKKLISEYKKDIISFCENLNDDALASVCQMFLETYKNKKKFFVAGNGGSAGTANHFTCDFGKNALPGSDINRPKIISLSANIEVLTALGNDFSYSDVFSEQLKNLMDDGDLVLLISASGNSPNVVEAAKYAKTRNGRVISFTGFKGGKLKDLSDININVPSTSYEQIEDMHMLFTHVIVCYFKSLKLNKKENPYE